MQSRYPAKDDIDIYIRFILFWFLAISAHSPVPSDLIFIFLRWSPLELTSLKFNLYKLPPKVQYSILNRKATVVYSLSTTRSSKSSDAFIEATIMKWFSTFSAIICALSIGINATPAAFPDSALQARADEETATYQKVIAAHPGAEPGKRYAFTLAWPMKPDVDDKTKALHQKLGCGHIALVVGEVKKTETGPKKKPSTKLDFQGFVYGAKGIPSIEAIKTNFYASSNTLTFVKQTSKTDAQIKARGEFYIEF